MWYIGYRITTKLIINQQHIPLTICNFINIWLYPSVSLNEWEHTKSKFSCFLILSWVQRVSGVLAIYLDLTLLYLTIVYPYVFLYTFPIRKHLIYLKVPPTLKCFFGVSYHYVPVQPTDTSIVYCIWFHIQPHTHRQKRQQKKNNWHNKQR